MGPERFRRQLGFAASAAAPLTLMTAAPCLAQGAPGSSIAGNMPLALALGVVAFGILGTVYVRQLIGRSRTAAQQAAEQVASLRAATDDYEALLSGAGEITVLWSGRAGFAKYLGNATSILPQGRRIESVLDYPSWLGEVDAAKVAALVGRLRNGGESFDCIVTARDGRRMRLSGWALGAGAAMRVRPALEAAQTAAFVPAASPFEGVVAQMPDPALLLDSAGKTVAANAAFTTLSRGKSGTPSDVAAAHGLDLVEIAVPGGRVCYLRSKAVPAARPADDGLAHLSAIINALSTPVAIFNANRELVQANLAYARLWGLDPAWLKPGLDERTILDRLRTDGLLPTEPDYQGWRAKHLQSYTLKVPRESSPWYLPDGRTVQVISAPAGPKGGVIYVFDDITDQLKLKSQARTQIDVQRSTLNALTEGVAVFGTNGRLTLFNPRLSTLWKLPSNLLATNPHIDQIVEAAGVALPEDGARLWRDIKRGIVDLNPTRQDTNGRITRADGRMLDYAVTRLPDGQTMMTFVDVTEGANYQRMLTERNEALVTADRLKDAFVQNVSYELRSPLTNIIGFADLLASEAVGTLNDKQKSYTDYIRASSVTLGVLIDNILDLATVDAGIAELRLAPQDVTALVDKARAGLAATFPDVGGEKPLNLSVSIPADLPPLVADGTRIVQVLYNLLSTAARFSEPGSAVTLAVMARGGRMQFVIEDEGAKVDEMRAALSDRADLAPGRERGAGLGLAIVRSFVSLHGGSIAIDRRDPRGSRVVVSLPIDGVAAGGRAVTAAE